MSDAPAFKPGIGRPNPDQSRRGMIETRIQTAKGERIAVTLHCIDRFWERAASGAVRFYDARKRLRILAREIGVFGERPHWYSGDVGEGATWLLLGEDIALLVTDGVARTCVTRAWIGQRKAKRLRGRQRYEDHVRRSDGLLPAPRPIKDDR